jgi:hypothetical protein
MTPLHTGLVSTGFVHTTHTPRSQRSSCLLTPGLCPCPTLVLVEFLPPQDNPTSLRSSCQPQVTDHKLSEQRAALERGQNPLPLYLSLNVKENNMDTLDFKGTVLSTRSPSAPLNPLHLKRAQRILAGNSCKEHPAF